MDKGRTLCEEFVGRGNGFGLFRPALKLFNIGTRQNAVLRFVGNYDIESSEHRQQHLRFSPCTPLEAPLLESLLEHDWARDFATRPGARVIRSPDEVTTFIERLTSPGALVA